ncbi:MULTISPECIES: fimbrial protein [unclassified Dyella]|uniref:fimbrial protein n=1 Tax=unclassified Dyella TaxID=2634549 RepID=UPI000C82F1EE|nr:MULTISPECIES: fimbrial protein [unclassified Dyella]MDR3445052.1 fimbrial protein [Dyella sp.]PMQ04991.1 F17a-G fimbrial adhesin [Dyella sp. AD56]
MSTTIRHLILFGLLTLAPIMPTMVHAAGTTCSSPIIAMVTGPAINVSNNAAIGDVIGTLTTSFPGGANPNCTSTGTPGGNVYFGGGFLGSAPDLGPTYGNGGHLYATTIPGVGFRVNITGGSSIFWGYIPSPFMPYQITTGVAARQVLVELVKIGPITQGGALSGDIAYFQMTDSNGAYTTRYVTYQWSSSVVVTLKSPACSVSTPSVKVGMGVVANPHVAVGQTFDPVDFNVQLNCSVGDVGQSTSVYMTISDATNAGNTSNILNLGASSTVTGLGIQLVRNGTPVSFGPDSAVVGSQNQFSVSSTTGGTINIPFTARYIATSNTVTPGVVNAFATFTFAYQ